MLATRNRFFPAALLGLVLAASAAAQQVPFVITSQAGPLTSTIDNGGVLTLVAPVGQSQTLQMRARYTGTGTVLITQPVAFSGSSAFTVTLNQALPLTLTPGQTLFFTVSFTPASANTDTARMAILFAETPTTTLDPISLILQGVAAAVVPSYSTPDNNNVVPLKTGDTIAFPETLVGTLSPINLNFTNIGGGQGQIARVSVSGADFVLQNLPLFPVTLNGGQTITMRVAYRPTATGTGTGTLTIDLGSATPITVNLQGSAAAPRLTYSAGSPASALTPGGTLTLPSIEVGQTSNSVVRVTNNGTANATVTAITSVGTGFQVNNPQVLPQTLAPGASLVFTVSFTPGRSGVQTGTLIINSDVFNLSGSGLGPVLTFSYTSAGATFPLGNGNNSIIFSPVRITQNGQLAVDIRNTGTTPAAIQNIGIGQTNSVFSIVNPPALPASLAPNAALRINLRFDPIVNGFANGTLIVDTTTMTLTGSGTPPPALGAYTLSGPSGTVAPQTQPTVSLKLAAGYPVAVIGVLTLAPTVGPLPSDPAVQFATGGRTIAFRIPANSTDAIFGAQGTQLGLQAGTVAGSYTLTPSFATQAGNVDLTPETPPALQFSVGSAAPTVLSVQLGNATATGFTMVVTGFSTTRTLTGMNIQLTGAPGFQIPSTQYAVEMRSIAATYFQSAASQAFGGQFRVTIPFTFQVTGTPLAAGQTILSAIASASVTVANESGTSTAVVGRP